MQYIDLHVHSNYSDGTLSPTELVALAMEKKLSAFALTDHDTVDGVEEALTAARKASTSGHSITVIPGAEISAAYMGQDIHILGLFLDYHNPQLKKTLQAAANERDNRNKKMCKNLQAAGIPITVEKMKEDCQDAVLTRAHFAKFMLKEGYVSSIKEAFDKYLDSSSPYYVTREYLTPETAVKLILGAGGFPVLAHPLLYKLSPTQLEALITSLKDYGLKGIEAIYSNNVNNDEAYVRSLARKYNLFITGGSDFHGSVKPDIDLGSGRGNLRIPSTLLDDMKK